MDREEAAALDLIERWDGIAVVSRHDRATGAWIFIALHDDTLGRPTGGTRMREYDSPRDGLRDAIRLAEAMTSKWAVHELPFGGGKGVIALPGRLSDEQRDGLLGRYGELLNALCGAFATGEELGTTAVDMRRVRAVSEHVLGVHPVTGEPLDPGPYTALGVFSGMLAALEARLGSPALNGRRVLVQGVGDVGRPLVRQLAQAGASVLVCDRSPAKARALADEIGGEVVAPEDMVETECDVYAPCAVGGVLNRGTIPRLRCRIVAGSANNQLDRPEDAERLRERGILYAPDYVLNAGAATAFALLAQGVSDDAQIRGRVEAIRHTLWEIFEEAAEWGESPLAAAGRRVERVLEQAREQRVAAGAAPPVR